MITYTGKSFKMWVVHRNVTWTLMIIFLTGALCSQWKVEYDPQRICAVKGSSVVILCSFNYPDNLIVQRVLWGYYDIFNGPFIIDRKLIHASSRFQYIGDTHHNCSLKIHQVEHKDARKYAFRFITNSKKGKWTGRVGSILKIVDLNISVTNGNGKMKEGDYVNLTCVNGCDDENISSAFTWFKNGELINEGPVLYLSNISSTNSGNYTCSLKTHTGTSSGAINIDVEYGPKNTSVSVRTSMEVDASSNITLICSSHANPPVENYTWFKIDDNDVKDVGHQPVFSPGHRGQYFCSATNKHGSQNSSVVTVKIPEYWVALVIAAVAVFLIVVTVIGVRRLKKKRTRAPETVYEEDIQNTDYVNWPVLDNNHSQGGNLCEEAALEVIYTTINFQTKRKSNMESRMYAHDDDQGVIYSTVCRAQVFNPLCTETL